MLIGESLVELDSVEEVPLRWIFWSRKSSTERDCRFGVGRIVVSAGADRVTLLTGGAFLRFGVSEA